MLFLAYSGLAIAIASVFSSAIVFANNPKRQTNITWALFAMSVAFWGAGLFFGFITEDKQNALFWARFLNLSAIFIPMFFVHFVYAYSDKVKEDIGFIVLGYFIIVLYFLVSLLMPSYFVQDVISQPNFTFYPQAGVLYYLFPFIYSIYVIIGVLRLFKEYWLSSGNRRNQIKYMFWGLTIGFAGGSTTFPLVFNIQIYPFGTWLVTLYVILTAYAITKHHLLDIEIVIKKTAVYSTLTALLTAIFVAVILLTQQFFSGIIGFNSIWASLVGAIIIAIIFQPLRDAIQGLVDTTFFRTRYDYQRILNKYSHALVRPMTDLDRYSRLVPYMLSKSLKLANSSVMVLDRETRSYIIRAGSGEAQGLIGQSVPEDSSLIKRIYSTRSEIDREDIVHCLKNVNECPGEDKKQLEAILAEMDKLKTVLVIPSISEGEYFKQPTLLSTINLGKKMSDEVFSREDVAFLKTLANQAGISIEYAFIMEELKRNQAQIISSEKLAALGTATAGIAHELKNPLTYLLTVAQSMGSNWDSATFKESVTKMLPSEVERMKLIIDGLSDYSKTKELKMGPVDMAEIMEKVLAVLSYEVKKHNIFIIKNYPAEPGKFMATGDKNRLVQVFINIVSNAIQAMGEKGGDLSISINTADNEVRTSITDTGPGIPPDKLQKIFDPFYTTKDTGTGLGLSITKKIIDEHNGSIYIDSHLGEGTTFTICLPRA
jgi:signal transduction histidine kinase